MLRDQSIHLEPQADPQLTLDLLHLCFYQRFNEGTELEAQFALEIALFV